MEHLVHRQRLGAIARALLTTPAHEFLKSYIVHRRRQAPTAACWESFFLGTDVEFWRMGEKLYLTCSGNSVLCALARRARRLFNTCK